jgi:hypothetical protein
LRRPFLQETVDPANALRQPVELRAASEIDIVHFASPSPMIPGTQNQLLIAARKRSGRTPAHGLKASNGTATKKVIVADGMNGRKIQVLDLAAGVSALPEPAPLVVCD